MWLRLIVAFTCVLMATASFAQGADQHVLGTIMAIDSSHVVVKTSKGQTVDVRINKKTQYKDGRNPKESNVPEVGDRVVIKATKDGKVLLATEVHYSAAKRVPAAIPPVPVQ